MSDEKEIIIPIKSFVYLDEYKMSSISSQLFRGKVDSIVHHESKSRRENEEQKGPLLSGRSLDDTSEEELSKTEQRVLLDYAYTQFESSLVESKRVLEISPSTRDVSREVLNSATFVRVSGRTLMTDFKALTLLVDTFNDLGEAMTYVTAFEEIQAAEKQQKEIIAEIKDRNKKAKAKKIGSAKLDIKKLAKGKGLNIDNTFLKQLAYLLRYGYSDQFEVEIRSELQGAEEWIFTAPLKRDCLREEEGLLIKKYSRQAQKDFTIFGIIAQSEVEGHPRNEVEELEQNPPGELRPAIRNLVFRLADVEDSFVGRVKNEIVIDPIAVYREI